MLEQVSNVACLPGLVGSALTMRMRTGGTVFRLAAFDPERGGIISAGGVGFDVSCGIRCLRANLTWSDIAPHADELADALFRVIPAGIGEEGELRLSPPELDSLLMSGAVWAVEHGFGTKAELEYVEERGSMAGAKPENVSDLAKQRQRASRSSSAAPWAPVSTSWSAPPRASGVPGRRHRTALVGR